MNNEINKKNIPFWFSLLMFILLFVLIGIIAFRNMREVFGGVKIDARIEQAENLNNNIFNLNGNAKHATFISINGREIFIQKNGDFKEKIAMPEGYSMVTIFARNKFGKDQEKTLEFYTPPSSLVVYNKKIDY